MFYATPNPFLLNEKYQNYLYFLLNAVVSHLIADTMIMLIDCYKKPALPRCIVSMYYYALLILLPGTDSFSIVNISVN